MAFLLTNNSGVAQTIEDLGNRTFPNGTVDFNLSDEFTASEIRGSQSLGALLDSGDITGKDTTYNIPGKNIITSAGLVLFGLLQNTDDIAEGSSNLYFTNGRVQTALGTLSLNDLGDVSTAGLVDGMTIISSGGSFGVQAIPLSVNTQTGVVVLDTDDIGEGSGNLYYTDARARAAISIAAGSTAYLGYNSGTGELSVTNLTITDVTVDSTETSLANFVSTYYTVGNEFQEGDTIVLTNATGGPEVWMHNGGTAVSTADFVSIDSPVPSDSYIRALISGTAPVSYDNGTGIISMAQVNGTTDGYLALGDWNTFNGKIGTINSLSPTAGNLDLGLDEILEQASTSTITTNFAVTTSGTIGFTTTGGASHDYAVTNATDIATLVLRSTSSSLQFGAGASVASITFDKTADIIVRDDINSKGLVYNADYSTNFTARSLPDVAWVQSEVAASDKKTWVWSGAVNSANATDTHLRGAGNVFTNQSPYIVPFACELTDITVSINGAESWTAEVRKNGTAVATIVVSAADKDKSTGLSVSFAADDEVSFYCSGTNINRPRIDAWFKET